MNYDLLSQSVATYVKEFFNRQGKPELLYHNIQHTEDVVAAAYKIGNHYLLEAADFFVIITAAWFHDTGYYINLLQHEVSGAELAAAYLAEQDVSAEVIAQVQGCILATRMPQSPKNELEAMVCDADLFHLGTADFKEKNKCMRNEFSQLKGIPISKQQWRLSTLVFLEGHHYHTDYVKMLLEDKKNEHILAIKQKAWEVLSKEREAALVEKSKDRKSEESVLGKTGGMEADSEAGGKKEEMTANAKSKIKTDKDKGKKKDRPDKGIETMFRVTAGNNQKLSNMADNKAHIMISVNSIILSAVISLLLRKLDSNEGLAVPTYMLITVSLLTIIFSILATRPTIAKGTFTEKDIDEKKTNLLFFGNFYKMQLSEYTEGMLKVMDDRDFLYGSLIKDVYAQGVILGKKYRLLRMSYNIFMYGLILSVLAFILASVIDIH